MLHNISTCQKKWFEKIRPVEEARELYFNFQRNIVDKFQEMLKK